MNYVTSKKSWGLLVIAPLKMLNAFAQNRTFSFKGTQDFLLLVFSWFFSWYRRQVATGINETGGKFATGVNDTGVIDTGGNLQLVSTTLAANNGNNIRLLRPESELEGKNVFYKLALLPKGVQTK